MPDETVIEPAIWQNDKDIIAAFSTMHRAGGYRDTGNFTLAFNDFIEKSEVEENRAHFLETLGLKNTGLALGKQVHGTAVKTVTESGLLEDTDGLVTAQRELALGIMVADCAAVLLADRKNGVIAAVHAGWRGAVGGILEKAISQMQSLGAGPDHMEAFISPCISQPAFEVGDEVASKFPDEFVDYHSYKKPHVDLKGYVRFQLLNHGLPENNLEISPLCTVGEKTRLHSFRRDKEKSGRMMGIIAMK